VHDIPPNTFVEGSVVFPPQSVPKAHQVEKTALPGILGEERRFADEANALRHRHNWERRLTFVLLWLVPLLMLLLLVLAVRRDRVPGVPSTLQEPPEEIHPVQLAFLWAAYRGRFSPKNRIARSSCTSRRSTRSTSPRWGP